MPTALFSCLTFDTPVVSSCFVDAFVECAQSSRLSFGENVQPETAIADRDSEDVGRLIITDQIQHHREVMKVAVPIRPGCEHVFEQGDK